jgi:hypothetical protein
MRTGSSFVHHLSNATLSTIPGKKEFEMEHILRLRKKWNMKPEPYFQRKSKNLVRFLTNSYHQTVHGHILFERPQRKK